MASPPKDSLLPDKQYFKIGEVAAIAGVKPSVLRYWETCFRQLRPGKSRANQRLYARQHVLAALEVKELLYERGFTIEGARRHLARPRAGLDGDLVEKLKEEVRELLQLCDE